MRAVTWAIRVTFANGQSAFLRHGGCPGAGAIVTFHSKARATEKAAFLREGLDAADVITVIERSHGRGTDAQ